MEGGNESLNVVRAPVRASEHAYKVIKGWIMSGELAPEQRIDLDLVAAQLGVSKMPIRSALEKLSAEDLVVIHPHRGTTVKRLSKEHLDGIYLVRCNLEALAIELAIEHLTVSDVELLSKMIDNQEDLAHQPTQDMEQILATNREFHMYIYKLAQSTVLQATIERLWDQSERYRRILFKELSLVEGSICDHRHLVNLIKENKAKEAGEFLVEHNRKTHSVVLSTMKLESKREE